MTTAEVGRRGRHLLLSGALVVAALALTIVIIRGSQPLGANATAVSTTTVVTATTAEKDPDTATKALPPYERISDIEHTYLGSGPKVAIVGDSLAAFSRPELRAQLSGYAVKIAASWGEGFGGGPISRSFGSDVDILGEAAHHYETARDRPAALVVALGTNNAWNPKLTLAMVDDAWDQIASDYRGKCLVAVTVNDTSAAEGYDNAKARAVNHRLRQRADVIVDWAALGTSDTYTGPDHIHLTPAGYQYRAELIRKAVDSCHLAGAPKHPPATIPLAIGTPATTIAAPA